MSEILILGGGSMVGSRFVELCGDQLKITSPNKSELDLTDPVALENYFQKSDAEAVVNFAAYTDVDKAENEKDDREGLVYGLNCWSAGEVAKLCQKTGKHLIHISTDMVFDGKKSDAPYTEEDKPSPLCWYGKTKWMGEQAVLGNCDSSAIVRIQFPFRSCFLPKKDPVRFFLGELQEGRQIKAINDQTITPVLIDDVAVALQELLNRKSTGIYHIVTTDWTTPFDLVTKVSQLFDLNGELIIPTTFAEYNATKRAKRPPFPWLDNRKFRREFGGNILHTVDQSLEIFKQQILDKI